MRAVETPVKHRSDIVDTPDPKLQPLIIEGAIPDGSHVSVGLSALLLRGLGEICWNKQSQKELG